MNDINFLVEQKAGEITFNFDETKAFLQDKMKEYKNAVFTDDTMNFAKGERAFLRKLKAQMEDERKNIKRQWMQPYDQFENKVKELTSLVDEPILLIDKQVKPYEEKKKAKKLETCREIYQQEGEDLSNVIAFEKIFNEKWLNVSTTMTTIREEISTSVQAMRSQIDAIKMMNSDVNDKALDLYYKTMDINQCIAYINSYETTKREVQEREAVKRELEEQRRQEAERERIRKEERIRAQEEEASKRETEKQIQNAMDIAEKAQEQTKEAVIAAKEEVIESFIPKNEELATDLYEYRIELSTESKEKLEMFMDSVGIEWELIGG